MTWDLSIITGMAQAFVQGRIMAKPAQACPWSLIQKKKKKLYLYSSTETYRSQKPLVEFGCITRITITINDGVHD